jgi:RNA polymerase sigma-32 factor
MRLPHGDDLSHGPPVAETRENRDLFVTYLREVSKHPFMTREEERRLALRVREDGDKKSAESLILANLRLVVRMAIDYRNHPNLLDLIQEGNMGLVHAVGKYDPERGTRFSSYAAFWIRAYMLRYLRASWSVVRVSTSDSQIRLFYSLNREKERLERAGITPTEEVLAENLAASIMEIGEMEQRLYQGDVSLEEPLYGGQETLMDTLGSGEDVENTVIEKDGAETLHKKLDDFRKRLNGKECLIFDTRIMAEDPLTLKEISERFNRTRERVRQMEADILKKLARALGTGHIRPSMLRGSARHGLRSNRKWQTTAPLRRTASVSGNAG